jgi:hypothetical protein
MIKVIIFSIACIVMLCTNVLLSQEIQVPMDQDGKISYIDSVMNNKIGIFDTYPGFIEARLFKLTDSTYFMEIYYMIDEKYNRHRKNMNPSEVDTFRLKVSQKLKDNLSTTINQEGRAELLWGLTLAGLTCYGPASIFVSDADGSIAVGLYMLTSAASFFIPYALTDNSPVSDGAARLGLWGSYSGTGHGLLLYNMLGLDKTITDGPPPYQYTYTSTNEQALWGLMALTSIFEAYAGYSIAQNNDFSAGKSDLMVNISVACTGILPGITYLAGVENDKTLSGTAILGTFSGYILGNYISNTQNYSRGDAMCFSNLWFLGAALPVSVLAAAKSEEPKLYVGTAILGAGIGMWVGNNLVKGKDFSTSQGVYMSLGSFGGAFVTGGIAFLAMGNNSDNWEFIPPLIALGAVSGFTLTYLAFADNPKNQEKKLSSGWNFDFNPMAMSTAFSKGLDNNQMYYYNPFLSVSYKF